MSTFVTPEEARRQSMERGCPIRVHFLTGATWTLDNIVSGAITEATESVMVYRDARGIKHVFRTSAGQKFEVLSPSAVT